MLGQPAPLVKIDQSGTWYSGINGSLFGGQNIARNTRDDDGTYRYTVFPLPVTPHDGVTLERLADAVALSLSGRIEEMVDVYRLTVERDGWMDSILRTMAHGLLGMPLSFQGDPEQCSALLDADGTPGDFAAMHPEAECAKIFADGIGIGFGLGQYVLMCWRCGGVDWDRLDGDPYRQRSSPDGAEDQICRRCNALRSARPIGGRELFQLRWRDARWLFRQPITGQWHYNGRQGMVPFTPGDGEWFLFSTVPDQDIWRNGPWTWGCVAAIMARDSRFDAANTSAVCAPTHVFKAKGPTSPSTRAEVEREAKGLRFGNSITLPGEWDHTIDAAKAEFIDVAGKIQEDSTGMWEVGVTGNNHGMKSGPGFSNMDVYQRVTEKRRAFYANAWARQLREQGLVWWSRSNYSAACPVLVYDVKSPEDKLAAVKALGEMGTGVASLVKGLKAAGVRPTAAQIVEICQRGGVRVETIPGLGPQLFDLDAKDVVGGITIDEWRADQGLPPIGDARGNMMVTAALKAGGPATPVAATPEVAPVPAPAAGAPAPPSSPAPPGARLEADDELEHEDLDDDELDARAQQLAGDMTQHGYAKCPHGRAHRCDRCRIQRSYSAGPPGPDGAATFPIAWRALKRPAKRAA